MDGRSADPRPRPGGPSSADRWNYKLESWMELPGSPKAPAYAVAFNHADLAHADLFAVARGPTVYIVRAERRGGLTVVQAHTIPPPPPVEGGGQGVGCRGRRAAEGNGANGVAHNGSGPAFAPGPRPQTGAAPPTRAAAAAAGEPEEIFCVAFTRSEVTGHLLVCTGGKSGILRVFDTATGRCVWAARGHGGAINDVSANPSRPALLLTASKDASLRVWHVDARACLAIAAGDGAHRAEVVSCDFHPGRLVEGKGGRARKRRRKGGGGGSGEAAGAPPPPPPTTDRFVSAGLDGAIKVWTMSGSAFGAALKRADAVSASTRAAAAAAAARAEEAAPHQHHVRPPSLAAAAAAVDIAGEATPDPSPAPLLPLPALSTHAVHGGAFVDCVRWLGPGAVASKSVHNAILAWTADAPPGAGPGAVRAALEAFPECPFTSPLADAALGEVVDALADAVAASAAGGGGGPAPVSSKQELLEEEEPASPPGGEPPLPPPADPLVDVVVEAAIGAASATDEPRLRVMHSMHLDKSDGTWFLRFGLDERHTVLAAGTRNGRVLVFDPHPKQPAVWMGPPPRGWVAGVGGGEGGLSSRPASAAGDGAPGGAGTAGGGVSAGDFGAPALPRRRLRCVRPGTSAGEHGPLVRQVAVSADGHTIVAACDDGTVWRFGRRAS